MYYIVNDIVVHVMDNGMNRFIQATASYLQALFSEDGREVTPVGYAVNSLTFLQTHLFSGKKYSV